MLRTWQHGIVPVIITSGDACANHPMPVTITPLYYGLAKRSKFRLVFMSILWKYSGVDYETSHTIPAATGLGRISVRPKGRGAVGMSRIALRGFGSYCR
jgi:hypothetical protein